jgi:mannose-1-phosphate guanylyltransferase
MTQTAIRGGDRSDDWVLVLAGGSGQRLEPYIYHWLGEARPKQYCVFTGTRSMLGHTLARAARVAGPRRTVLVIGRGHRRWLGPEVLDLPPDQIVEQPEDCGTATGIFLGLSLILARSPGARVIILPSDHFLYPESGFIAQLHGALAETAAYPESLVLLGAHPDGPNTDYGWIVPRGRKSGSGTGVAAFQEKPEAARAEALYRGGALWNTMIMTAYADTLWQLGQTCTPRVIQRFAALLLAHVRGGRGNTRLILRDGMLEALYRNMPRADFSRDIVQQVPQWVRVVPLSSEVQWSDWGRPERILETLNRMGLRMAGHAEIRVSTG